MTRRTAWKPTVQPLGTVRARLTVLYTGLFLVTSTIMLTVVNLLLKSMLDHRVTTLMKGDVHLRQLAPGVPPDHAPAPGNYSGSDVIVSRLPGAVLQYQWTVTAITIAVLTVISVAVGWWLAGRLLRPLRHITATAHRLS
ncbi:MAG: transporter substrate-binding protein, partial [Actinomycetia bacterium]|nr:transporter substrate-binding protein [Actinomycetes bacterium]